jgi:hypothetical protein
LTISGSHEAFYESSVKTNTHIDVVGYDRDANGGEEFAAYFQGKLTGVDCPVVEDTCTGDDITYTGYVSDVQCTEQRTASESFRAPDNNIDPLAEPEKHTVNCLYNIKSCRESGYDILDEDATDGLYVPPGGFQHPLSFVVLHSNAPTTLCCNADCLDLIDRGPLHCPRSVKYRLDGDLTANSKPKPGPLFPHPGITPSIGWMVI